MAFVLRISLLLIYTRHNNQQLCSLGLTPYAINGASNEREYAKYKNMEHRLGGSIMLLTDK